MSNNDETPPAETPPVSEAKIAEAPVNGTVRPAPRAPAPPPRSTPLPYLPARGSAMVKAVSSGDTVILLGRRTSPKSPVPEITFTFERVSAPRMASKGNNFVDGVGAYESREALRKLLVGKVVQFETRKQGVAAGDRAYGLLFFPNPKAPDGPPMNLAVEATRAGHAIPKINTYTQAGNDDEEEIEDEYERALREAYNEAQVSGVGIHSSRPSPYARKIQNSGEDYDIPSLIAGTSKMDKRRVKCVIEYVFDGSRVRCQVSPGQGDWQFAHFTLILAGVSCPRLNNNIEAPPEEYSREAKSFVETRLLHRELDVSLCGTDKTAACAVGTIHHPMGNIAVELLKNGLARICDWSARLMNPLDVPAFRVAETNAKRTNTGLWHAYAPPVISGSKEISGTVIEVLTGDTITILPDGEAYDSDAKVKKYSLASVRSPRVGNEKYGKPDEPWSVECKERLRTLSVGKQCKIVVDYERDIPIGVAVGAAAPPTEKRQFATISAGKNEDLGEVLIAEGLAETQRHRDEDEKSSRYDSLVGAETASKAAGKGIHSNKPPGVRKINDLNEPRKAKTYAGFLQRSGKLKAIVEYVFNGSRFKVLVPKENCSFVFALSDVRCPNPSPMGSNTKPAEPFGDESKRHGRLNILQRMCEITCTGVTNSGVITGDLWIGGGQKRKNYTEELIASGLVQVEPRRIEYGDAPQNLMEAQTLAQQNKMGMWANMTEAEVASPSEPKKATEEVVTIKLSEIRNGSNCFAHIVGDEAVEVIEENMKIFTTRHGTSGAPCEARKNSVVAALFDAGNGKSWYRARVIEKRTNGTALVLYIDHGNLAAVPIRSHIRPLEMSLNTDRVPAAAKELRLGLIATRDLSEDDGLEAAHMLQSLAWGKNITCRIHGRDEEGKLFVTLYDPTKPKSINQHLVDAGVALAMKQRDVLAMGSKIDAGTLGLLPDLVEAQDIARKSRVGMWRYGDVGDDDDDDDHF